MITPLRQAFPVNRLNRRLWLKTLAVSALILTLTWLSLPHLDGLFLRRALGWPLILHASVSLLLATLIMGAHALTRRHPGASGRWIAPALLSFAGARLLSWRWLETLPQDGALWHLPAWTLALAETVGWCLALAPLWRQALAEGNHAAPLHEQGLETPILEALIFAPDTFSPADARDLYRTTLACQRMGIAPEHLWLVDRQERPAIAAIARTLNAQVMHLRPAQPLFPAISKRHGGLVSQASGALLLQSGQIPSPSLAAQATRILNRATIAMASFPCARVVSDGRLRNLGLREALQGVGAGALLADSGEESVWLLRLDALTSLQSPAEDISALTDALRAQGYAVTHDDTTPVLSLRDAGGSDGPHRALREDLIFSRRLRNLWGGGFKGILDEGFPYGGQTLRRAARLIFLLSPAVALLAGVSPLTTGRWELATFYFPAWVALALYAHAGSTRHLPGPQSQAAQVLGEAMGALNAWRALLFPSHSVRRLSSARFWIEPALLLGVLALALGVGIRQTLSEADASGLRDVMTLWAFYNVCLLASALCASLDRPRRRQSPRVRVSAIPCVVQCADRTLAFGRVINLSETGLMAVFNDPIPLREGCQVTLLDDASALADPMQARPIRSSLDSANRCRVAFEFDNVSEPAHRALAGILVREASAASAGPSPSISAPWRVWAYLVLASAYRWRLRERPSRRQTVRMRKALTCELQRDQRVWRAVARDVSENGMAADAQNFPRRWPRHAGLTAHVTWEDGETVSLPARVARTGPWNAEQQELGLVFEALSPDDWRRWIARLYPTPIGRVRSAFDADVIWPCRVRTATRDGFQRATIVQASPARIIVHWPESDAPLLAQGEVVEVQILNGGPSLTGITQHAREAMALVALTTSDWPTLAHLARWMSRAPESGPENARDDSHEPSLDSSQVAPVEAVARRN